MTSGFAALLLLLLLLLLSGPRAVGAFVWQPTSGQIWDPSVTFFQGSWYAHAMYQEPGDPTNVYTAGWVEVSADGVHWTDGGAIAPSQPGDQWWKCFVRQIQGADGDASAPPLFVMNHGVLEHGRNDALRILTSADLLTWTVNTSATSRPNSTWYNTAGRWDHMYMRAVAPEKGGGGGAGGFIGYPVSSPTVPGFASTWPGVQRSPDGIRWTSEAPLPVRWNGVAPTSIEEGGVEKIGDKYYLIGGGGGNVFVRVPYSMWVFVADSPLGPFAPLADGFRLSGGGAGSGIHGWLAAWCGPDCGGGGGGRVGGPLISNYQTPVPTRARADVWALPMRRPVVESGTGRLRLAWWEANAALKGDPPQTPPARAGVRTEGAGTVAWIANFTAAEHNSSGGIVTASVAVASGGGGEFGVVVEDMDGKGGFTMMTVSIGPDDGGLSGTASQVVRVEANGAATVRDRSSKFVCGPRNKTCGVATVTGLDATSASAGRHDVRVLFRKGMWEWYLDSFLVQTATYGQRYPLPAGLAGGGRVGVVTTASAAADVADIGAWRMSV